TVLQRSVGSDYDRRHVRATDDLSKRAGDRPPGLLHPRGDDHDRRDHYPQHRRLRGWPLERERAEAEAVTHSSPAASSDGSRACGGGSTALLASTPLVCEFAPSGGGTINTLSIRRSSMSTISKLYPRHCTRSPTDGMRPSKASTKPASVSKSRGR